MNLKVFDQSESSGPNNVENNITSNITLSFQPSKHISVMKNINLNSIFVPSCNYIEIAGHRQHLNRNPLFDPENTYSRAGILIWHFFEDRLFLSDSFCKMVGVPGISASDTAGFLLSDCTRNLQYFLRRLQRCLFNCGTDDLVFKARIPGTNKTINGYIELFDMEIIGILDIVIICFMEEEVKRE